MDEIIKYAGMQVAMSIQELIFLAGPVIGVGFLLQYLTDFIRTRLSVIFGWKTYVYLTAPGTIVHESAHALVALIFMHKVKRVKFFSPKQDGTLGSVEHAWNPNSRYQTAGNFFIGTAPLYFGAIVIMGLGYWLLGGHTVHPLTHIAMKAHPVKNGWALTGLFQNELKALWQMGYRINRAPGWFDLKTLVFIYLVFAIGNHMTLSPEDLRGSKTGIILIIATMFLFNLGIGWMGSVTQRAYMLFAGITGWILVVMLTAGLLTLIVSAILYIAGMSIKRIRHGR